MCHQHLVTAFGDKSSYLIQTLTVQMNNYFSSHLNVLGHSSQQSQTHSHWMVQLNHGSRAPSIRHVRQFLQQQWMEKKFLEIVFHLQDCYQEHVTRILYLRFVSWYFTWAYFWSRDKEVNVSLIEFMSKIRRWSEMSSLGNRFNEKIQQLERNFSVVTVVFKK